MILVSYFLIVAGGLCTIHGTKGDTVSWTGWCNEDTPDTGGVELERLDNIKVERCPDVCANPDSIECRVVRTHQPWDLTGDILINKCDVTRGLSCINSYQPGGRCHDYEVRYLCPRGLWSFIRRQCKSHGVIDIGCIGAEVIGAGSFYWTSWCDKDGPYGRGDEEIAEYCRQICADPVSVECRVVRTHDLWNETGDVFDVPCSPAGLTCLRADQPNKRLCQDYEIRFRCPSACDGKCGHGTHCVTNSNDNKDYCLCQDGFKNRRKEPLTNIYKCSAYTDCVTLSQTESKCYDGSRCENSVDENDEYTCVCDTGFTLTTKWFNSEKRHKYSCDDIDECSTSPCGPGNCTNTIGGFLCRCEPPSFTATDRHSCLLSPTTTDKLFSEEDSSAPTTTDKLFSEEDSSAGLYVGIGVGIGVGVAFLTVVGIFLFRRFLKKRSAKVTPAKEKPLID